MMPIKINIALTPAKIAPDIIGLARKFSRFSSRYLLGKNSHPHVTLYQFKTEESEIASIWQRLSQYIVEKKIQLTFQTFSFIRYKDIYWLSLLPEEKKQLHALHQQVAELINLPIKTDFDPHMTLINTHHIECEEAASIYAKQHDVYYQDNFILSLGLSDEVGQFTKIIY